MKHSLSSAANNVAIIKRRKPRRTISDVLALCPPHLKAVAREGEIEISDQKWRRTVFYGSPGDCYTVLTAINDACMQIPYDRWAAMEALQIDYKAPDCGAKWDLVRFLRDNHSVKIKVRYQISGWYLSDANLSIKSGIERGVYAFYGHFGRKSVRRAGGGERHFQTLWLTIIAPPPWPPKLTALVS